MSTYKGSLQYLVAPIALVMAILIPVQPVLAAVTVGQTASADAKVDGIRVPSGTTLISPTVVESGDAGAVIHLSNGEVVAMAPQSAARVADVDGSVQLAVQKGNVAYTDNAGAVATLSPTETMLVSQEGQIQEGARIDSSGGATERLCELQDWTAALWQQCLAEPKSDGCDWEYLEVSMSETPQYVDKTAVLACKDRNDQGLDCDCKNPKAFAWWIPVAAVAGGLVLYEVIDKDDEDPASPTTP